MHASPHLDGALHLVECLCEALSEAEGELSDHPAAAHLVSDRVVESGLSRVSWGCL